MLLDDVPVASILDLLHTKQLEIKQRLGVETERLARLKAWLKETEKEGKMPELHIVIKKIKPQKVLSIRRLPK
jgi:hypothetical protein